MFGVAWAGHFGYRLWQFNALFEPHIIDYNFRNMPRLFDTNLICKSGEQYELEANPQSLPEDFSFTGKTIAISEWIESSSTTGLVVIANNKVAFEQYYQGNTAQTQAISWSVAKSFVSALIGFAVSDGSIRSLQDPVNATMDP